MFARLFAFLILSMVLYIASVFLIPTVADTLGNREWNDAIRSIKSKLESSTGITLSEKPLIESMTDIAKPYIDETKTVTNQIKTTVETKTIEVKQVADSVQKAYNAVESAKNDVQKITTFGSGSR